MFRGTGSCQPSFSLCGHFTTLGHSKGHRTDISSSFLTGGKLVIRNKKLSCKSERFCQQAGHAPRLRRLGVSAVLDGKYGPFYEEDPEARTYKTPAERPRNERRIMYGQFVEKAKKEARMKRKRLDQAGGVPPPAAPPNNGLLVPELVPVAHDVLRHWEALLAGVRELMRRRRGRVWACTSCREVFVGRMGHALGTCTGPGCSARYSRHLWGPAAPEDIIHPVDSFHLPDRLGPPIHHEARFDYDRIPAVVELAIQAGVDVPGLASVRRTAAVPLAQRNRLRVGRGMMAPGGVRITPAGEGGGLGVPALTGAAPLSLLLEPLGSVSLDRIPPPAPPAQQQQAVEEPVKGSSQPDTLPGSSSSSSSSSSTAPVSPAPPPVSLATGVQTSPPSPRQASTTLDAEPSSAAYEGGVGGGGGGGGGGAGGVPLGAGAVAEEVGRGSGREGGGGGGGPDEGDEWLGGEEEVVARRTLDAYLRLREGLALLMKRYQVKTCGYCPEVSVGPRGHRVRICNESKQQRRQGKHGWRDAELDDLLQPKYVLHLEDPESPEPLRQYIRGVTGQAPAVVELCVQAGAPVPEEFRRMMRVDPISPKPVRVPRL